MITLSCFKKRRFRYDPDLEVNGELKRARSQPFPYAKLLSSLGIEASTPTSRSRQMHHFLTLNS